MPSRSELMSKILLVVIFLRFGRNECEQRLNLQNRMKTTQLLKGKKRYSRGQGCQSQVPMLSCEFINKLYYEKIIRI